MALHPRPSQLVAYMNGDNLSFPAEILYKIVDAVAEKHNAYSILCAIAQVSHVMLPHARKHIYETIDLSIEETDTIARLSQSYAANPTLLAEIPKTLNIFSDFGRSTLLDSPLLGTIISHMQNLRTLSLTGCNVEGKPFIDVFAAPSMGSITSLEIRDVQLTFHEFSIFLSSPRLTYLRLAQLIIVEYESSPDGEDGIDFSSPICGLPQPRSALKRPVQDLRLDIITTSDAVVMDLIATSRYPIILQNSLVNVSFSSEYALGKHVYRFQRFLDCNAVKSAQRIHLGDPDMDFFTEQDSSEFPPLRFDTFEAVELRVGVCEDWNPVPEFQWWAKSLRVARFRSPLKELHLMITFNYTDRVNVNELPDVSMHDWRNLDGALCGRNLSLKYLTISIVNPKFWNAREKVAVERWFFTCLPKTYEKYFAEGSEKIATLDIVSEGKEA
ncbi:uncharacterized protein BT62DRAFT_1004696 [Guyanagaster necrorhizus]|uniref:F-box domain-containing protein n=1 Tax=Guyanagaster necrorhizus TaxID=856835 RepID=A0A9P7VTC2_9AGAR|nr:uncharacterized protein BT62DRAFT_1004696 [Guyanagaster necrorhizus MCA 3950]KAG7447121.1 hypothetical protein BT62DRAFT_1004696 [Guyanagaster necrorhizus MCA 3950]